MSLELKFILFQVLIIVPFAAGSFLRPRLKEPQVLSKRVVNLNRELFDLLVATGGEEVPLHRDRGFRFPWRHPEKARQARFPPWMMVDREPPRE